MKSIFWLSLISILYAYFGYPILVWALSRLRPRPWKKSTITPSISILLAVHNGAALLDKKVEHLLTLDYPNLREVIVVSDGSSDGTAEMLAAMRHPLLKTIVLTEHAGKAVALNAGIARATGEILVFVDIRPEVAAGSIQTLVNNFADPAVGCVAGELLLRHDFPNGTTGAITGLYWRYEQWIRKCESLVDSPVGVYGGFYAVRRELVQLQPDGLILDDMFQPLSIIRQGYRSVLDPDANVFDVWPKKMGAEFHRKVRTLAGNFQLIQLAPWLLTTRNRVLFQFVSHKVMRLVVPYLSLLLLASTIALSSGSRLFALIAIAQLLVLSLAVAGLFARIPLLNFISGPASALLMLNAAAVVGLYKFCFTRGPLWRIWTSGTAPQLRPADAIVYDKYAEARACAMVEEAQAVHADAEAPRP
ncbi:MAG: glycosyltransferase family 2 protein [Terracidiphilus sp.]